MAKIDLTDNEYKIIKDLLNRYIPNILVWAYGSRVKGTSTKYSDLDMVVFSSKKQNLIISDLKTAFEESNLPFKVDLFAWTNIPEQFYENIKKEHIVLQNNQQPKTYVKYKDSGIEWIGEIPQHWEVKKLKNLFQFGKGLTITRENLQDHGIQCVNYGEIHSKYPCKLKPDIHQLKFVSEAYLENNNFSLISRNDFVFADTSEDIEGSGNFTCLLSDVKIFAGYHTIVMKPLSNQINGNYFSYLFDSWPMRTQIREKVQGVKVYSISQSILKNNVCFYPSFSEQQLISDYLDKKCGAIDGTIEKEQLTIQKLKEYKQSLITETVTKGLDKNASMKDSGIEWIGEIPQGWSISKIGQVYSERNTKVSDKDFEPLSVTKNGIVPQLETVAKSNDSNNRKLVLNNDFVINSRSDRRSSCGISKYNGSVSLINTVLAPKINIHNIYYNFAFKSEDFADEFYKYGNGIVDDLCSTKWVAMKNIFIPLPSPSEQQLIADYLDKKCRAIDETVTQKEKLIEKLTQYKKSLIYEYVTGKRMIVYDNT